MRSRLRPGARVGITVVALALVAGCSSGGAGSAPVAAPASSGAAATVTARTPTTDSPTTGSPGNGSPGTGSPGTGRSAGALPRPDHVVVVVFENESADGVLGSVKAPYLSSLAASGANFTDAHGETHPSQPNYLALFSGSVQGVTDDSCLDQLPGPSLGGQLLEARLTFVGWSEGLPEPGYTGCTSGDYARRHSPWAQFADLPASVNQPLSAMPSDYDRLPTVSFVAPDLCHDMHDCGVAAGDTWARRVLDPYVSWARDHDSQLWITFDEDNGSRANHIPTFIVGAGVRADTSDRRVDHYDLLRTLEDMYGLAPLGKAADARAITDVWAASR